MRTRTSMLCVCVGALLTVAVGPPGPLTNGGSPSPQVVPPDASTCTLPPSKTTADTSHFDRLSIAYAPTSSRSSTETVAPPVDLRASTLWLARAIYSETKQPHEQELVAWVIRNRVDTRYRGNTTYREVVLDPYQFSAFNPGSSKRSFFMQLGPETSIAGWQQALWVAYYVRHADPVYRPFSIMTRHFYSERSMDERRRPYWAEDSPRLDLREPHHRYTVDDRRFRFYKQIS